MTRNLREIQCGKITRKSFGRIKEAIDIPYLVEIQKDSYDNFVKEGISEVLEDFSPITDYSDRFELYFLDHVLESKGKYTEKECRDRSATYAVPLKVKIRLVNKETGHVMDSDVFMGDFPLMTDNGSFIVNGAERVIVSQLVRSPGVYNDGEVDKSGKKLFGTTVIPSRGAWLEFEQDSAGVLWVHVDRTRKLTATVLLRALGYGSNDALTTLFANDPMIAATIEKDTAKSERDGLIELYKRLRPGDIATEDSVRIHLRNLFFDPKRYDLARVGRYKFNKKLKMAVRAAGLIAYEPIVDKNGEIIVNANEVITKEQASAIQNAGINEILVSVDGKPHKVIANHVADFEALTGINPRKFGLLDTVYYPIFEFGKELYEEGKTTSTEELAEKYKKEINERFYLFEKFDIPEGEEKPEDKKTAAKNLDIRIKFIDACKVFFGIVESKKEFENDAELRKIIRPLTDKLNQKHITVEDIVASVSVNLDLNYGIGGVDKIDHLANRRVKSVGELLQNQFRIGVTRLEKVIKERMNSQNAAEITPSSLINVRPVSAAIKEFFGSSQLSQFMDQTNPIAELTHKRKLSALGPGGLSRDRATNEVRDINHTHYGRICPIETPEGQNIGLINSLTAYAKVNEFGFIEAPYRKVDKSGPVPVVTNEVEYLAADVEDGYTVAQANEPLDEEGHFVNERIMCRRIEEFLEVLPSEVDYMDVSPKQVLSVATELIPFLENDDTNRALMGSNMQRQAVPLLNPDNAIVATGIEGKIAYDSGVMITAKEDGTVKSVASDRIVVTNEDGVDKEYSLKKFERSNNGTCINQKPLVDVGEKVKKGDIIADGPATKNGELALGKNILIGFQSWEGYNYEDAILLSEKLVREDAFTSIHIEEKKVSARDTKLGEEEITREIPNLSEEALKNLDERGIVKIGTEVKANDILVGKVTPKGEQEATPEVRLLRAILGNNERDVKDTSEKVKNGEGGIVVDVKVFDRADKSEKNELPPGVNKEVRVYIAQKRKISIGDKMAGRHGNKGIVSRILPEADMPFMADGTPLQIVLNPLGVPSRMNIGQVLEVHLGLACKQLGWKIATPVFDGAKEEEIKELLANNCILNPDGEVDGKIQLYDGRTGEPFENRATVGQMYMIKLHHLVDDKMHARSTGPYSMVTQQPLGGKAQKGGQRFGEMEVWALEAYGAAHVLQEILTVKSDDIYGRDKTYQSIVCGKNIGEPGIPESFKVLIKELQSLALDMKVLTSDKEELTLKYLEEDNEAEAPKFKGEVGEIEVPTDAEMESYDVPDMGEGDLDFMSKDLFDEENDDIDTTVPDGNDDFGLDDLFDDDNDEKEDN